MNLTENKIKSSELEPTFNFRIRNNFELDEKIRLLIPSDLFITAKEILSYLQISLSQSNVRKISSSIERLRLQGFRIIADRSKGYKLGTESEWMDYKNKAAQVLIKGLVNLGVATEKQMKNLIYEMEL